MLEKLKSLLADPPPEFVFEVSESGLAWARGNPAQTGFEPWPADTLAVNPATDNLVRPETVNIVVRKIAAAAGNTPGAKKRRPAVLMLPDYCGRTAVLDFDSFPSKPEEQVSLIRFRMRKTVPFDADASAVSYYVQPGTRGEKRAEVVASMVSLDVLARYEGPFRAAGFHVGIVTTSTLASFDLLPAAQTPVLAKMSNRILSVAVLNEGRLKLLRCVELSEASMEEVAGVLYPTFAYMEDELKMKPAALAACGFGPLTMALEGLCATELGIAVEPLRSQFGTPGPSNAGLLGYLEGRGRA